MNLRPAIANNYFQDISQNVGNWEFNATAALILSGVAACIFVAIVLNYVYNKMQKSSSVENIFNITNPKEIATIFNFAHDNRSKFELSFSPDSSTSAVCSLTQVLDNHLQLELPAGIHPTSSWEGRSVYIFFKVPLHKDKQAHYFFTSFIAQVSNSDSEFLQLKITFPSRLQQKQKRMHLRLDPSPEQIEKLVIWDVKRVVQPPDIKNSKYLDAHFTRIEADQFNRLLLLNISGGGMMLSIPPSIANKYEFQAEQKQKLLIYLRLLDPDANKSIPLYLFAQIKNSFLNTESKNIQMGLQFLYSLSLEDTSKKQWEEVDPTMGVEPISNWVFKQHLKLYREKGIT